MTPVTAQSSLFLLSLDKLTLIWLKRKKQKVKTNQNIKNIANHFIQNMVVVVRLPVFILYCRCYKIINSVWCADKCFDNLCICPLQGWITNQPKWATTPVVQTPKGLQKPPAPAVGVGLSLLSGWLEDIGVEVVNNLKGWHEHEVT